MNAIPRVIICVGLLAACGTPGTVSWVDGPDSLDGVGSALWLDVTETRQGEPSRTHGFLLTDSDLSCVDWEQTLDLILNTLVTLPKAADQYYDKAKSEAACLRVQDGLAQVAELSNRLELTRFVQLSVRGTEVDDAEPPAPGTYATRSAEPEADLWLRNYCTRRVTIVCDPFPVRVRLPT